MSGERWTVRIQLIRGEWLDCNNAVAVTYTVALPEEPARGAFDVCCEVLRRAIAAVEGDRGA